MRYAYLTLMHTKSDVLLSTNVPLSSSCKSVPRQSSRGTTLAKRMLYYIHGLDIPVHAHGDAVLLLSSAFANGNMGMHRAKSGSKKRVQNCGNASSKRATVLLQERPGSLSCTFSNIPTPEIYLGIQSIPTFPRTLAEALVRHLLNQFLHGLSRHLCSELPKSRGREIMVSPSHCVG